MDKGPAMWSREQGEHRDGGGGMYGPDNGTIRSMYQMKWHEKVRVPSGIRTETMDMD